MHQSSLVEKRIKEIKRRTRKKYNTEEKIRIVLEGLKEPTKPQITFKSQILSGISPVS